MSDAAELLTLFRRRAVDLENMAAGQAESEVVVRNLDVHRWGAAVLIARVHANSLGADRSVELRLYCTAPSPDQPDFDFVSENPIAMLSFDASSSNGSAQLFAIGPGLSSSVRLEARAINGSGSGSGGGEISLSADLLLRAGTPTPMREVGDFVYSDSFSGAQVYVPLQGTTESTSIGAEQSRLMAFPGVLERVGLYASANAGSTIVSFHKNGSTTASSTAVGRALGPSTWTEFPLPASGSGFEAGDRIHIGVTPSSSPGSVNGYYIIRYGRMWG